MRWALVLIVLAGCDKLLSLQTVQPRADASSDALGSTCSQQTPAPFLCADFDQSVPTYFVEGVGARVPDPVQGVTITTTGPSVSPPGALWIDSHTAMYEIDDEPTNPKVTDVKATFSLQVMRAPPSYALEVFEVGFGNPVSCGAYAQINNNQLKLLLRGACSPDIAMTVLPAIPLTATTITLEITAGAGASVTMKADMQSQTIPVTVPAGTPVGRFGALYVQAPDGPWIGFDDVIVEAFDR